MALGDVVSFTVNFTDEDLEALSSWRPLQDASYEAVEVTEFGQATRNYILTTNNPSKRYTWYIWPTEEKSADLDFW